MRFITDLHIHSRFSTATSRNLVPEHIEYWARLKGVKVIGTGDCVHPGWLEELKYKLEPAGNGLFRLKDEFRLKGQFHPTHPQVSEDVFFILTGEISSIYKKGGRIRKVHSLCVFPDFKAVEGLQQRLSRVGNIASDGRPIIGLDARYLLEYILESSEDAFLIPAHIWTPWFSVLGSKSGFNSVEECFEDLTPYIFALETGLSSDPPMNRACTFLDRFTLVSNSDAHSPEKIGREANLFDTDLTYRAIHKALRGGAGFKGTIEFFPQEGKYHYDGHRKCGIRWNPLETIRHHGVCTRCGKDVTKGVMFRVAELSDRRDISDIEKRSHYLSITSLPDLLAETMGYKSGSSTKVKREYMRLIARLGSELWILLFADLEDIRKAGGNLLSEGIKRLRDGRVIIEEGFDGEYGRIKVFTDDELRSASGAALFIQRQDSSPFVSIKKGSIDFDIGEFKQLRLMNSEEEVNTPSSGPAFKETSALQRKGIEHFKGPCMVIAGPGSGKTHVLTKRIIYLIRKRGIPPSSILALTFSNKAAQEMMSRVKREIRYGGPFISTFHAFGLSILKKHAEKFGRREGFFIIDEGERKEILKNLQVGKKNIGKVIKALSDFKQGLNNSKDPGSLVVAYEKVLIEKNAFDLDDLIYITVKLLKGNREICNLYRERYQWILVDEFQDINASQYELLRLLIGDGDGNLFVIGDPDQAIYGFRGSDPEFIERIRRDYPSIKVVELSESYRCPGVFLKAGAQVLKREKHLTGMPQNVKVVIHESISEASEAEWIASQIEKMIGGVRSFSMERGTSDGNTHEGMESFSHFSILCRTTSMFDPFIKALGNHGIPYQIVGNKPFFQEEEDLRPLLQKFRSIYSNRKKERRSHAYVEKMFEGGANISEILSELMKESDLPAMKRGRLLNLARHFGSDYDDFINSVALRQGVDDYDERMEAVSLLTLHASKGLEFETVFIPGCEKGIIPFELAGRKGIEEVKEEERLFYVGVTRARRHLFLTYSLRRHIRGRLLHQERSPFLDRMEKDLLEIVKQKPGDFKKEEQLRLF